MDQEQMRLRTKEFAKSIIYLCRQLPRSRDGMLTGNQIFRSGTSIGENYRAACRGRSRADYIAKLAIALEEADETHYWLDLLAETETANQDVIEPLIKEANELVSIFVASLNTARKKI